MFSLVAIGSLLAADSAGIPGLRRRAPVPETGLRVWHLFEDKYTGLANKDAGDFKGEMGFMFTTFSEFEKTNPEASMESNILEMSEVNVTGWGKYQPCNAPGCTGSFTCPADGDYCCSRGKIPDNTTLPGKTKSYMSLGFAFGDRGFWYSFPRKSQGVTWTEKVLRRIKGKCLGNEWRKDAGGCDSCGEALDQCVATCILVALNPDGNTTLLQATWDRVFSSTDVCPDVPLPDPSPTPTPPVPTHYGQPPCRADEVEISVSDKHSVCTPSCGGKTTKCPRDLPGNARGLRHAGATCGIPGSKFAGQCYVPCNGDADCDRSGGATCVARHPLGACSYPAHPAGQLRSQPSEVVVV